MRNVERELILNNAIVCDESIAKEHLKDFVLAFVTQDRQERWQHLLLHNSKNAYRNSSKLEAHLDKSFRSLVKEKWVNEQFDVNLIGIYYRFSNHNDKYMLLSLSQALVLGEYRDAIFSIHRGKLGFYFSHESRIWLLQRPRQ